MNFEAEVHRRLAKEGIIDNLPRYERLATPYRDDDPFIIKLREEIALAEKERLEREEFYSSWRKEIWKTYI